MATRQAAASSNSLSHVCSSSEDLPLRIKVNSVHSSLAQQLSVGTILDVFMIKKTETAILSFSSDKEYLLPLNSSVKFSPVYNPENDTKKALLGYRFNSIKQLLKIKHKPTFLYTRSGYLYGDESSCMEAGDVYILKDSTKKGILVEDAITSALKMLQRDCECDLISNPSYLSMFPSEFFAYLKLPTQVMLNDEKLFTVAELVTHTSLIASVPDSYSVIELYLDSPIEVEIVCLSQEEDYYLTLKANMLHGSFTPDKPLFTIINNKYSKDNLQKSLLLCRNDSIKEYTIQAPIEKCRGVRPSIQNETPAELNKRITENYDCNDVAELLQMLGIGEYSETFKVEKICGKLLMLLDDDILLHELGVKEESHRAKLLQIITGERSIKDIEKKCS